MLPNKCIPLQDQATQKQARILQICIEVRSPRPAEIAQFPANKEIMMRWPFPSIEGTLKNPMRNTFF